MNHAASANALERQKHVVDAGHGATVPAKGLGLHEGLAAHPFVEGGFAVDSVGQDEWGNSDLLETAHFGAEIGEVGSGK